MRVRMLQTATGASDALGQFAVTYMQGDECDVLDSTAAVFIGEGWAVPVDDEAPTVGPSRARVVAPDRPAARTPRPKARGKRPRKG